MDFRVHEDIEVILGLLGMTIQEFAQELGVCVQKENSSEQD